jgi:hypothetical protein
MEDFENLKRRRIGGPGLKLDPTHGNTGIDSFKLYLPYDEDGQVFPADV